MKVADIMTQAVITVKTDTSLNEAAGILAKMRIHGMPVVDSYDKVVGIITESDFFMKDSSNIYLPTFLDFVKSEHRDQSEKKDYDDISRISTVGDILTSDCHTVRPDFSVEKLIGLFKETNFNTVPVVNDDNILVGIVTIMDILKLL